MEGVDGRGAAHEGPFFRAKVDIRQGNRVIEYDKGFYTPTDAPRRCCGGLSTLRGTPPQHLFDVVLFWNDPRDPNYSFKHRSILKSYLESLSVALGGSWAQF